MGVVHRSGVFWFFLDALLDGGLERVGLEELKGWDGGEGEVSERVETIEGGEEIGLVLLVGEVEQIFEL